MAFLQTHTNTFFKSLIMKLNSRFFILTFVLFIYTTALTAQRKDYTPELYVGANFGATASMVNFDPAVEQSCLQAYNGGLVFRYIAQKSLGFQSELNYSQRGWNEVDGNYARQLNYIELPIMTHFNFGKKFRFFFNIGPKFSYLISEKVLINNNIDNTIEQHAKSAENKLDYGFCGGFGFLFNLKGQVIQIDTRVNYSMTDVFSNAKKDYFAASNNMNLSVNIGWLMQMKNKKNLSR